MAGNIADAFLQEILRAADERRLWSHKHFTVHGTLFEAWANQKRFRRKDGTTPLLTDTDPKNPTVNFHGEKLSNTTHASVTDPEACLARKRSNSAAVLANFGSVVMGNRRGLIVATAVRSLACNAERDPAVEMLTTLEPRARRRTLGADKGYDAPDFVVGVRAYNTTPHVVQNIHAKHPVSVVDGRTTRHPGFEVRQVKRNLVEEGFGWAR